MISFSAKNKYPTSFPIDKTHAGQVWVTISNHGQAKVIKLNWYNPSGPVSDVLQEPVDEVTITINTDSSGASKAASDAAEDLSKTKKTVTEESILSSSIMDQIDENIKEDEVDRLSNALTTEEIYNIESL